MIEIILGFAAMAFAYSRPIDSPYLAKQIKRDQARREHFGRW